MADATTNGESIIYNSEFRHGVDEKRRVQVPAKWRPSHPDVEFTLVLWHSTMFSESHLLVLPPDLMASLASKIRQMSSADPQAQSLRRLLGSRSANVPLDKAGRICLPEEMSQKVKIEKDAVLVGLIDRFEIWNPDRYKAAQGVDAVLLPDAFKLI